jgi:hypothetical protein
VMLILSESEVSHGPSSPAAAACVEATCPN